MARQNERVPPGQARLEFKVYAPLNFGETLRLCGSTLVLGSMQHEQGIDLLTSSSTYPVWSTKELVAVFTMERIEYRYAVYRGGTFHRWEDLRRPDENRYITVRLEVSCLYEVCPYEELRCSSCLRSPTGPLARRSPSSTDSRPLDYCECCCNRRQFSIDGTMP